MSRYYKVIRRGNVRRLRRWPLLAPAPPTVQGLFITLFLPKVFPEDYATEEVLDLCDATDVKRWHWWVDLYAGKLKT